MEDTRNHPRIPPQFAGSAVVVGASYGPGSTVLRLHTSAGELLELTVCGTPDVATAELGHDIIRPLSVQIQHGGERCSIIALTPDGPRRREITLGTALRLHQCGTHTVVDGGLQSDVPCSPRRTANFGAE